MAPRLPKGGRRAPALPASPARAAVIGDNSEARDRAEQAQLLSFVSRMRSQRIETDKQRALLKVETDREAEIMRLAVAAGFKKGELKEHLEDLSKRRGREVEEREQRRIKHRRWLGLPVGEAQADLEERMPAEARDEVYWAQEGHRAGLTGGNRAALPEGMDTRFVQIYLSNFDKGKDAFVEITAANAPKSPGATRKEIADQVKADLAEENAEAEVAAKARKLKNDPAFMDRSAPEDPDFATDAVGGPGEINPGSHLTVIEGGAGEAPFDPPVGDDPNAEVV